MPGGPQPTTNREAASTPRLGKREGEGRRWELRDLRAEECGPGASQASRPPEGKEKRGGGGEKRRDVGEERGSKREGGEERKGREGISGSGHVTAIVSFPPSHIKPDALGSPARLGPESDSALVLRARSRSGAVCIVLHRTERAQTDRQSGHADSDRGKTMSGAPAPGTPVTLADLFSKYNHRTKYKQQHFSEHHRSANN